MLKNTTGTSATGTGVADFPEFAPMDRQDSYDGVDVIDDITDVVIDEILDAEYLTGNDVIAFDLRVDDCYSGDCTVESICLDCLAQFSVAG